MVKFLEIVFKGAFLILLISIVECSFLLAGKFK